MNATFLVSILCGPPHPSPQQRTQILPFFPPGCSGRACISMETDSCEGAEDMEKGSGALGVSYFLLTSCTFSFMPIHQLRPPPPLPPAGLAVLSRTPAHKDPAKSRKLRSLLGPSLPSRPHCTGFWLLGAGSSEGTPAGTLVALRESWGGPAPALSGGIPVWDPRTPANSEGAPRAPPLPSSSRDFSSWTTVTIPVPPRLFWTREKASGERKVMVRRTRECERGKKGESIR